MKQPQVIAPRWFWQLTRPVMAWCLAGSGPRPWYRDLVLDGLVWLTRCMVRAGLIARAD